MEVTVRWLDKRFHSLNYALRRQFGQKMIKLSLDGGFTCPNRDGTIARDGCLFCSEEGGGEFAGSRGHTISDQLRAQVELLRPKWPDAGYIAYFQNFTGTYASLERLGALHDEALAFPGVRGIAIATRPDALGDKVIPYLNQLKERTFVWVELGLQTIHPQTAALIGRGYGLERFEEATRALHDAGVRSVVHLIMGLPGEGHTHMIESARAMAAYPLWGIKLHLLHVLKNTRLEAYRREHPFALLSREQYLSLLVDIIEHLPPDMVVHRFTGDGHRDRLVAPLWPKDKRAVLNGLDKLLAQRDTYQGRLYTAD